MKENSRWDWLSDANLSLANRILLTFNTKKISEKEILNGPDSSYWIWCHSTCLPLYFFVLSHSIKYVQFSDMGGGLNVLPQIIQTSSSRRGSEQTGEKERKTYTKQNQQDVKVLVSQTNSYNVLRNSWNTSDMWIGCFSVSVSCKFQKNELGGFWTNAFLIFPWEISQKFRSVLRYFLPFFI